MAAATLTGLLSVLSVCCPPASSVRAPGCQVACSALICTPGMAFPQLPYMFRRSSVVAELFSGSGTAALPGFWQGFINPCGVA